MKLPNREDMEAIKPYDLVALLADLPDHKLRRGDVGTVVDVFEANDQHPSGYLIEFFNEPSESWIEVDVIDAGLIMKLHLRQKAA